MFIASSGVMVLGSKSMSQLVVYGPMTSNRCLMRRCCEESFLPEQSTASSMSRSLKYLQPGKLFIHIWNVRSQFAESKLLRLTDPAEYLEAEANAPRMDNAWP